jgi:cold shock CspA family protein
MTSSLNFNKALCGHITELRIMTDGRKFGKVKLWNANSAYGFIAEHGYSKQHFFHVRDIVTPGVDEVPLGQCVEFELGINKRNGKPQAVSVKLVEPLLDDRRAIAEMAFLRTER